MKFSLSEAEFKKRNSISNSDWEKSECKWEELTAIANHYIQSQKFLEETAQFFAKVIQTFSAVHSVRWRVKDVEHVLEKIVRKRAKKEKKYANIDISNYFLIVTDLIGVRALHLFKDEYLQIDEELRSSWKPKEKPLVYLRKGDTPPPLQLITERGFKVKDHPAGYRSVHYVVGSNATKRQVFAEIQIRTIFEEGWSEIDHRVRYPNHIDDELVAYFLGIFNRMAGSADEMGSFVQDLVSSIDNSKKIIAGANTEKAEALAELEKTVAELDRMKEKNKSTESSVAQLKHNIARLKNASSRAGTGAYYSNSDKLVNSPAGALLETLKRLNSSQAQLGPNLSLAEQVKKRLESTSSLGIQKKVKTPAQKLSELLNPELDEFGLPKTRK